MMPLVFRRAAVTPLRHAAAVAMPIIRHTRYAAAQTLLCDARYAICCHGVMSPAATRYALPYIRCYAPRVRQPAHTCFCYAMPYGDVIYATRLHAMKECAERHGAALQSSSSARVKRYSDARCHIICCAYCC
ncbi:hypothetical protein NPIL_281491 [Nephila pilipes]|uniref:Uncharacterized protein n=1 Tax=Nephila pilipes TaxID=299642 RepID=A0A8X6N9D3_NEPPI|nr:hypothetical protein NPIL_281491 [Nephila pilipes]